MQDGNLKIINSFNYAEVNSNKGTSGGIIGCVGGHGWDNNISVEIFNSGNLGKVNATQGKSGGIIGSQGTTCKENYVSIKNTYNVGNITGETVGNIIGEIDNDSRTETKTELENVYYTAEPSLGKGNLTSGEATLNSQNEIKSQTFVDLLNQNIGENSDWKKWKLGEKGYPEIE